MGTIRMLIIIPPHSEYGMYICIYGYVIPNRTHTNDNDQCEVDFLLLLYHQQQYLNCAVHEQRDISVLFNSLISRGTLLLLCLLFYYYSPCWCEYLLLLLLLLSYSNQLFTLSYLGLRQITIRMPDRCVVICIRIIITLVHLPLLSRLVLLPIHGYGISALPNRVQHDNTQYTLNLPLLVLCVFLY